MNVLIDTNVVLDHLVKREPFYENAERIRLLSERGFINSYISASAVTDIYYIANKELNDKEKVVSLLEDLLKTTNTGQVILPIGHPNLPEQHEIEAAHALARYYQCSVEFLTPVDDYKRKTADIVMQGKIWEIKCPIGTSRSTIGNQFRVASKQARNIIIDSRRTSLDYESIEKTVIFELKNRPSIKHVIIINKSGICIAFNK